MFEISGNKCGYVGVEAENKMLPDGGWTKFTCFAILSDWFSLVQFAKYLQSTCCMKDAVPCPLAVKMGLRCSLYSVRFLTVRNTKIKMQIIEMTACCVMRLATKGHRGWRWVGMCVPVAGVRPWGDGAQITWWWMLSKEAVWQQLHPYRNIILGKLCRSQSWLSHL